MTLQLLLLNLGMMIGGHPPDRAGQLFPIP
jgi:hypothetical protein